jgi:aminoglycoside phosphotransferase family enzyme
MTKTAYPEYHKALLDQNLYPAATRRIKFEETRTSLLYKSGQYLFKIRKTGPHYSSLAVKEAYAQEALRLGQRWAPGVYEAVVPIVKSDAGYAIDGPGTPVEFALRMKQLPSHSFVDELLAAGKLSPVLVARVARFLADQHAAHPVSEAPATQLGRPEHFRGLFEEITYQVKKYLNVALSEAVYDMFRRPVERFTDDERKLFLRRIKRQRIVEAHGAFVPAHVHARAKEIVAVSPLESAAKFRLLDAAADVATFCNELHLAGALEQEALFAKRYASAAKDRDLPQILPAYEVLQATRDGLALCEWRVEAEGDPSRQAELARQAHDRFNLAVLRAREIPKPE